VLSRAPTGKLGLAVVMAEDEHFYSNFIIDIATGMGRAAVATIDEHGDPGGSTIMQQRAKQLYGRAGAVGSVLEDIGLAVKLSLRYSKQQILSMYLNAVYYGNGYCGEQAAARGYFDTTPQRLDWAEAAMLAGLLQAPSAYDPVTNFELA
jgi:penicillin-binding protein 1A